MKNKVSILLNLALAIGLFISLKTCSSVTTESAQDKRNLEGNIKGLEKQVSVSGDTIYKMGQLIIKRNSELAGLIEENEAIRKVSAQVKIKDDIDIMDIQVPFDRPLFKNCDSSKALYLKLPVSYRDTTNAWYKIYGAIDSTGNNKISRITIYSEPIITLGYAKEPIYKRLFKVPEKIVTYTNKNPYITVKDMQNVIVQGKDKGRFGISIQTGYGIILPNLKRGIYIGIGGDYRIISF